MNLKRILQLVLTNFIGQGVSIINQLLVPPFFLYFYANGLEIYGEWIALSASVNYLGTLNYGVQTYANNQMTILYNRGEVEESKTVQASALRLLLLFIGIIAAGGLLVFFVPIDRWLNLKHVGGHAASLTLYLLMLQIAVSMILALLTNSFMVVGRMPRGNHWNNAQRLTTVLAMSIAVALRAPFPVLALVQLSCLVLYLFMVMIDIRRIAPILLPSLRYGSWKQVRAILKPSGHFGLIALAGFLTWQGPVLVIQKILGPTSVAIFALVRTVFQMSRQLLSVASYAVGQDITLLVGQRNWTQLRRLYDLSERVVIFLIPIVSIGSLLMCPFLFTVWLHKRAVYQPTLCLMMAITSAILGIKEHKTQFQQSSNEHEELSKVALTGYAIMLLVSVFTMKAFGLQGFIVVWIVWEIIQTGFILRMNVRLFPADIKISMEPVVRLFIFMVFAFGIAAIPTYLGMRWSLPVVVVVAILVTGSLSVAAYFVFGLQEVREVFQNRMRRKFAPSA